MDECYWSYAPRAEYDIDWADENEVTSAKVMVAANGNYKTCKWEDEIKEMRQLRKDGKCDAKPRIAPKEGRLPPRRV